MDKGLLKELNSSKSQITIVDSRGAIQYINDEWLRFSQQNDSTIKNWIGYDYFNIFNDSSERNPDKDYIYRQIIAVISGKVETMCCFIECSTNTQQYIYEMMARPIRAFDSSCILIEYTKVRESKAYLAERL